MGIRRYTVRCALEPVDKLCVDRSIINRRGVEFNLRPRGRSVILTPGKMRGLADWLQRTARALESGR